MRRIIICLAAAFTVIATPALAKDGAWYVGGDFGAALLDDIDESFPAFPAGSHRLVIDHDSGYDAGLFLGYDMGAFRLEGEVSYKRADANDVVLNGVASAASGETTANVYMINGVWDVTEPGSFPGIFVGAGAGVATIKFINLKPAAAAASYYEGNDNVFAMQVFGGLVHPITENLEGVAKVNFLRTADADTRTFTGIGFKSRYQATSVTVGFRYQW